MESENKIISDVSEKTNSLSVVPADETMKSAVISAAKESEEKDVEKDRKKSRKESKDRSDRKSRDRERSHRRTSKAREEDRRRSSDRSRRRDREREGERRDKDKEGDRERRDKDKEGGRERRDKDKEGDRERRDKDKEGDKEKDKTREKDREKDSCRDRERERDRDRDRGRSTRDRGRDSRDRERSRRSSSRSRRDRDSRRRRSRSASPDDRHRNKSRRRSASPEKKSRDDAGDSSKPKPITLRDIIALNPGISVPEAAIRLNAYNTAVARGLTPESVTAPLQSAPGIPMGSVAAPMMMSGGINPVMAAMMGEGGAATKPHRELYVGNLPPGITVPQIAEFMNAAFKQMGLAKDNTQNTVITAWVSPDGKFAFVELRSIEDATAALTHLNGIQVGAYSLRIGRPKGYNASALPGASAVAVPMQTSLPSFNNPLLTTSVMGSAPGLGNSNPLLAGLNSSLGLGMPAEAMSNAIMVTNLPALISEAQIRELFTPFGDLQAFNVIKTPSGSTQSAVLEYVNPALTEGVIGGMNGLDIADHKLSVLRIPASSAAVLLQPTSAPPPPAGPPPLSVNAPAASTAAVDELSALDPTTVIRLSNMTTSQDLTDDQSFEELMEDVADECNSHGTVKSIVIPRTGSDSSVGKIFVHFVDIAGAQATRRAVAGRKFNGRVVEAYFFPEALFLKKTYCLPAGYLAEKNSSSEATLGNGKAEASQNGSSSSTGGRSASADINDIDEGEHEETVGAAASAVYDPSAVMEDLD